MIRNCSQRRSRLGFLLIPAFLLILVTSTQAQESTVAETDTVAQDQQTKSPTGAMLRSLVFPGWGQWYNGKKFKAGLAFVVESALIARIVISDNQLRNARTETERAFYLERRNVTYWWLGGAILLSMLDAYVDAYLYDFDAGPDLTARVVPAKGETEGVMLGLRLRF